mmetsp:Transcript_12413/g.22133  ORF Transcript_12413/g.22133 Transcript_12413/m.22133 type:complete len:500 (+) Transcript_12413:205-1704(+)
MEEGRDELLFMGFNQDAGCVSVGSSSGYRIFNCQPFGRNILSTEGGIGIVEILFSTSLVALVGAGNRAAFSPCHLKLWNSKTAVMICELDFSSPIQAVKMNRKRLIVVLQTELHIYNLDTMVNLQTLPIALVAQGGPVGDHPACKSNLLSTPLCELSPDENNSFLALPANQVSGDVFLYDALNLVESRVIRAHKAPLTAMKFSLDGTMLATASEMGTLIRVFKVQTGEKLHSFRRGSYAATVYSLAFDEPGRMLAASSSNGTVHVFSLDGTCPSAAGGAPYSSSSQTRPSMSTSTSNARSRTSSGSAAANEAEALDGRNGQGGQGDGAHDGENNQTRARWDSSGEVQSQSFHDTDTTLTTSEHGAQDEVRGRPASTSFPMDDAQPYSSRSFLGAAALSAYAMLEKRRALASKILPESISDLVEPTRSFAVARLKNSHVVSRCALAKGLLCVVTSDGQFYQYSLQHRGECNLVFENELHGREGGGSEDDGFTRFFKGGQS